jgi:hypothetical protein
VESYDPEESASLMQPAMLSMELRRNNQEAAAALDRVLANVEITLAHLERRSAA